MASDTGFRDISTLRTAVQGALVLYLGLAIVNVWSDWMEMDLLQRAIDGFGIAQREAEISDERQSLLGGIKLLILIATAIAFLRWTYVANANARALGAGDMEYTPGWAVGWYFIPFATLWKPYQAMKEMYRASHPDFRDTWREAPSPAFLPVWWGLWLASNLLGRAALRTSVDSDNLQQFLDSSRIMLATDALDIPLTLLAIAVVAQLSIAQTEKHRRLTHAGVAA
jgi:hypothetical protein